MTAEGIADAGTRVPDRVELELIDAYWRAANYLSVKQIYLMDNPCFARLSCQSTSRHACSATGARPRDSISFTTT